MSYTKQNFEDGWVLTAAHLNHMEEGIATATTAAKRVLLWESQSGYAEPPFEPQTILLAPVTCDGIEIVYCTSDDGVIRTTGFLPNTSPYASTLFSIDVTNQGFSRRDFVLELNNSDSIVFYDGYFVDFADMSAGWESWTIDQNVCIPIAVYGINL